MRSRSRHPYRCPRAASLSRVDFYRSDSLVETAHSFGEEGTADAARTIPVEAIIESGRSDDFIRVVARLSDGREREDAQLLQGANYQSEIDIQLAQFQVLVTDRDGNPVGGLSPEDFEIREDRRKLPAVALHTSYDVPLVLGLAIDSSDSMLAAWGRLKYIARTFSRDRGGGGRPRISRRLRRHGASDPAPHGGRTAAVRAARLPDPDGRHRP